MASLTNEGRNRFRIEANFAGKRRKFYLSKVSKKSAEEVRSYITRMERLRSINMPFDRELQAWLDGLEG
jgi:hypothetical protein